MSQEAYIFEVTEKNFTSVVIQNSDQLPVIVEFMGVWSEHCFITEQIFTDLAKEFAGKFIFAKVDIDEQAELRQQYQIENVPTIKVFHHSKIIQSEEGLLQESEARALLSSLGISHESDRMREEAREKHLAGDTATAVMLLTQAIQKHPANTRVAMDMVQIFIDIGELENAQGLFNKLPKKDQESEMGKALTGQLVFRKLAAKTDGIDALQQRRQADARDHAARFDLAICQLSQFDSEDALDNLLYIVENAPDFHDGAAREMIVTVIQMLTPTNPELAREYQRKLSNLMAK